MGFFLKKINKQNLLRDAPSELTRSLNLDTELATERTRTTRHFSLYPCDYPMRRAREPPFKPPVAVPGCSPRSPHTPYCLGGLCPFWAAPPSRGARPRGLPPGRTRAFKILSPGSSCGSSTYLATIPVALLSSKSISKLKAPSSASFSASIVSGSSNLPPGAQTQSRWPQGGPPPGPAAPPSTLL